MYLSVFGTFDLELGFILYSACNKLTSIKKFFKKLFLSDEQNFGQHKILFHTKKFEFTKHLFEFTKHLF